MLCDAVAGNFGSQLGNVTTRHATKRAQHCIQLSRKAETAHLSCATRIESQAHLRLGRNALPYLGLRDLGLRDGHLAI